MDQSAVFLSHAHADKDLARHLAAALLERGVRVWIDHLELRVGDSVIERVSEAIAEGDFLVAIVSPDSVRSQWCQRELAMAATKGIDQKSIVVLPIRYRGAAMPPTLVDRFWADADESDVAALADRLIRDMRSHRATDDRAAERTWLRDALSVFRTETSDAQKRWRFHLEGANRTPHMDVPINGLPHYETVLKLCRIGALAEIKRSPRFIIFEITDRGRLLRSVLQDSAAEEAG